MKQPSLNSGNSLSDRADHDGPSRNLASISPFFIVKDLQASIAHYIERFGFTLDFQGPADDVYYAHGYVLAFFRLRDE